MDQHKDKNKKNSSTSKTENSESNKKFAAEESNVTELPKEKNEDPTTQIRNDYLYLRAEFDNYKKNVIKERSELLRYGGEKMVLDFVSVLDVFEKALSIDVDETNFKSFKEGIELTAKEFRKALEKHGINEIPSLGESFDPNIHEALTQVPSADHKEGTVIEVFKKGYKYHDKTVRPSQVVVSKEV